MVSIEIDAPLLSHSGTHHPHQLYDKHYCQCTICTYPVWNCRSSLLASTTCVLIIHDSIGASGKPTAASLLCVVLIHVCLMLLMPPVGLHFSLLPQIFEGSSRCYLSSDPSACPGTFENPQSNSSVTTVSRGSSGLTSTHPCHTAGPTTMHSLPSYCTPLNSQKIHICSLLVLYVHVYAYGSTAKLLLHLQVYKSTRLDYTETVATSLHWVHDVHWCVHVSRVLYSPFSHGHRDPNYVYLGLVFTRAR